MDRFGRNAGCTKMCEYECRIYENIDGFDYIFFGIKIQVLSFARREYINYGSSL